MSEEPSTEEGGSKDDQRFETLEALLAYLSPMFEARRQKLLFDKLEDLAMSRRWDEGDAAEEVEEVREGA
jgi:hypothetical protein